MELNPQGIQGPWSAGIVLDWHTVDSECVGENEFGYPIFDTTRSAIGELLYRFKYRHNNDSLEEIVAVACQHLARAQGRFDLVLPVPPSSSDSTVTRRLAEGLADCLGAGFSDSGLIKCSETPQLKSVSDPEVRKRLLVKAFAADSEQLRGKTVLLVDDVYRSGATLSACATAVLKQGRVSRVYVLAITRTRVNQ